MSTRTSDGRDLLVTAAPLIPYASLFVGLHLLSSAWAAILSYHVGILVVLAVRRPPLPVIRLPRGRCMTVLTWFTIAALLAGPVVSVVWSTARLPTASMAEYLADVGLTHASWALFAVYYATVNPVLEELFWRGSLFTTERVPALNDLWFGAYHVLVLASVLEPVFVAAGVVVLTLTAWAWRQTAVMCHSLTVPIVTHAAADVSLILFASSLAP